MLRRVSPGELKLRAKPGKGWPRGRRLALWLSPLLLGLVAVFVRGITVQQVFRTDGIYPFGRDAFYHLRRIQYSVDHFPSILAFDPFINFPHGALPIWPPTFDWLAALVILPWTGPNQPLAVERLAVWLPPVLGGITVVLLFWIASRHFDRKVALLAAGTLAIIPAHFWYSQLGFVDHHVLVALVTTQLLGAAMLAVASPARRGSRTNLWLGLSMAAALLVWPGSLIHVAILQAALVMRVFSAPDRESAVVFAQGFARAHAVAFVSVLPLTVGNEWEIWGSFSPMVLSNFQPVYLAIGAVCFMAAAEAWRRNDLFAARWMRCASGLAMGVLLLAFAFALFPPLSTGLVDAWAWFTKDEKFQSVVAESLPFFRESDNSWRRAIPINRLGATVFVVPGMLLFLAWRSRGRADLALLVWWSAVLCVSTINQRRFMNSYSIAHVLLLAWLMREAYEFARVRFSKRPNALKAAAGIGIALFTMSFVPSFEVYRPNLDNILMALQGKPPTIADQRGLLTVNAARWLGKNSPEVDGAGYSVMGAWGDGHILKYAAQRPVVQDNFGDDVATENFALAEEYFLSPDEGAALALLARTRSRYVLVRSTGSGHHGDSNYPPDSLFTRLFLLKGAYGQAEGPPPVAIQALERHRLIHESPPLDPNLKPFRSYSKLFEVVRGAVVVGEAEPGAEVWISLRMKTRHGGKFVFHSRTDASSSGHYRFRIPYSNERFSRNVEVAGNFSVGSDGKQASLVLTEEDVLQGLRVTVSELK